MIDVEIGRLLKAWEPRIGAPTCASGCSACCERMTVVVSSPEALALVEAAPDRAARIDSAIRRMGAEASLNSLLDTGPCVFLEGDECSVYSERPDGCRACYVWHDSAYCGRQEFDMCVPAELNRARLVELRKRMFGEFALGRKPFRGYLLPAVWLMSGRREEYLAGGDLSIGLDPQWIEADLVEFPTEDVLRREAAELDAAFRDEYNPLGFPRASRAKDRRLLQAFDLRV